ncbi:hypothetical protein E2C01_019367 [Portunus trituberculatus]|uniref:Uncharacterized protein n=1 Tax=Portunus trituberculatus TaxID=210409 RepID=A0A5B7DX03_PORTR|nr:hypothetical protein [Portunus trituberculatus]
MIDTSSQRDIDKVHRVTNSWDLHFILNKCAVLCYQRGSADWNNIASLQHYHMDNTDFSIQSTHKDSILIFHLHISTTVKKAAGLAEVY